MMLPIRDWIKRQPLAAFILLAYGFSWLIQIPLAMQSLGIIEERLPYGLHYLTGYGPLLSAVIVTGAAAGRSGLQELLQRLTKWRVGLKWWLVAISPLLAGGVLSLILMLIGGETLSLADFGQVDRLPALGIGSLVMWLLTFGLGEETGWRGFLLPYLQRRRSALKATLILWIVWSAWHLPLFFYMYDLSILPGLLLGLLAGAVVFTWIYNSTGGSVLMTIVWHASFNYVTACSLCKAGSTSAIVSALVMVWAVVVVLWFKPAHLSTAEKITLPSSRAPSMHP
jgi:membrane protease YdiL (CAAX protease family)